MPKYIVKRLAQTIIVVWGILTIVFLLVRLSGDPIALFITDETPPEDIAIIRKELGLDKPLYIQYIQFLKSSASGDFGKSLRFNVPAMALAMERLPASLELLLAATTFALLVAIPLGIISAVKKDSIYDTFSMSLALLGQATPAFWLGTMLMLVFSVELRWFPTSGKGSISQIVLPMVTLGAYLIARTSRFTRSGLLEILGQDYIRTARAKGFSEAAVIRRHALKNVSILIVTVIGLDIGAMLAGAIITETLFTFDLRYN